MRSNAAPSSVSLPALVKTAVPVALATAAANVAVWMVGGLLGSMTIGAGEVITGSLVGVGAGVVALAVAGRFFKRSKRAFLLAGSLVLVLYALGPISAAVAPYREGAELFTGSTVLAPEVMHLVSGVSIMAAFTREAVLRSEG